MHHGDVEREKAYGLHVSHQARPLEPVVKQWLLKVDDRLPALEVGSVNGDEVAIFDKRRRSGTTVMPRESGATATYVLKPVG